MKVNSCGVWSQFDREKDWFFDVHAPVIQGSDCACGDGNVSLPDSLFG